jgi:hypothetical protein
MLGLGIDSTMMYAFSGMDLKQATSGTAAGLRIWLKNNTGVTAAKWTDSSGRSNHATQSTEGNQAAVSGGGLDFESGESDHYDLATKITISANQGFCLALVVTRESSSAASILGDSSNELIQFNNAHDLRLKTNAPGNITTDAKFATNTFAAGSKFLLLINRSAGASNRFTFFKNGNTITADTDTSTNEAEGENPNGFEISVFGSRDGSANFLDGIVHELAFWDRSLTTQEIVDVNYYLKNIHGL